MPGVHFSRLQNALRTATSLHTTRDVLHSTSNLIFPVLYNAGRWGFSWTTFSPYRRNMSAMSTNTSRPFQLGERPVYPKSAPLTSTQDIDVRLEHLTRWIAAHDPEKTISNGQRKRLNKNVREKRRLQAQLEESRSVGIVGSQGSESGSQAQSFIQTPAIDPPTASNSGPNARFLSSHLALRPAQLPPANQPPVDAKQVDLSLASLQIQSRPAVAPTAELSTRPRRTFKEQRREPLVPPSAASGGIPIPSPQYLSLCTPPPQLLLEPQPLLLVIDLNGTLLHRPSRSKPHSFVKRPHTDQFLNFVLSNFSVMIWSSAQQINVNAMCEQLFPPESRKLLVGEWSRDHLGLTATDHRRRVQVYKRLQRVWSNPAIQLRHPQASLGRVWHQGNTVLLDDSVEKSRSEPHNFVEVIEFTGAKEDPSTLRILAEYLSSLRTQANVSSYIRQYPLRVLRS